MTQARIGLYLHIPFCRQKCPYCDFYSLPLEEAEADRYTEALCRAMRSHPFGDLRADTLYLGGGTPSLLGAERLGRILETAVDCFGLSASDERTLEANPGTVDRQMLQDLRKSGYNRISFGVQSLQPQELTALGRRHTAQQAVEAIEQAAAAGFARISADLMLATPGQTPESLQDSIHRLCALPLDHISAYLLKVEEGTPFHRNHIQLQCPDEDTVAQLYLDCVEALERAGFPQYEISNFATPGGESRHNLKYWRGQPYLGIGPAAHSFVDGKRFYFPGDLTGFTQAHDPWSLTVQDGTGGAFSEYAMLRLRLCEGLDTRSAAQQYAIDPAPMLERAAPLQRQGLLEIDNGTVRLTPQGFLLSNAVTAALLAPYD